jgi:hypothetical protein
MGTACVFTPYIHSSELHEFASMHNVFGASNIIKFIEVRSFVLRARSICLSA